MEIITAQRAREMTVSREQMIGKLVAQWTEKFNTQVTVTAQGPGKDHGATKMFFEISAGNEVMLSAKSIFINSVRNAGFEARMHDSNDENDYFVYEISWGV